MLNKYYRFLILVIILSFLLAGCKNNSGNAAEGTQEVHLKTFGVTLQDASNEFIMMLQQGMQEKAAEYSGVKLIIEDAEAKPYKQIVQMATFIAQRVDAIIINPADATLLIPAIEDAIREGIPVITLSSDVNEDVGQYRSGSNNVDAGEMQARRLAELLGGHGNVLILTGPVGHIATIGRSAGYEKVFEAYKNITIVHEETANWQREQAMSIVQKCIHSDINFDAVLSQNDAMALGALQAIHNSDRKNNGIIVCGIDAIEEALDAIKNGQMAFTCFQDAKGQAFGAIELAVNAVNAERMDNVMIPFSLVEKKNVDEYYDKVIEMGQ